MLFLDRKGRPRRSFAAVRSRLRRLLGRGRASFHVAARRRSGARHARRGGGGTPQEKLARRCGRCALHVGGGLDLEDRRLRDDRLSRRTARHSAGPLRSGSPRRRRAHPPFPQRHLARPRTQRGLRGHHHLDPLLSGVRCGPDHDPRGASARHRALRLRHLRADLPEPACRAGQRLTVLFGLLVLS